MKDLYCMLIVFTLVFCANPLVSQNNLSKEANSATGNKHQLEKLVGNYKFTEGPAVDAQGNVYFSDLQQNIIFIWTTEQQLDTFRLNSGRANGLYFDKDENLLTCEGNKGQITLTSPDGNYVPIATAYNAKRFNQPNDLWPDPKGGVYFTDPKYGSESAELSQDGMHVYYINPGYSSIIRVCDDIEKPNGLIGTPDGNTLYVTDAKALKTYKYDIEVGGTLKNKTLFAEFGCDGMTIDREGNIYLTTSGKKAVDIFSPSGKLLKSIEVPEKPTNVCFGGKERNQLFITARTSVYRVEMDMKGVD